MNRNHTDSYILRTFENKILRRNAMVDFMKKKTEISALNEMSVSHASPQGLGAYEEEGEEGF